MAARPAPSAALGLDEAALNGEFNVNDIELTAEDLAMLDEPGAGKHDASLEAELNSFAPAAGSGRQPERSWVSHSLPHIYIQTARFSSGYCCILSCVFLLLLAVQLLVPRQCNFRRRMLHRGRLRMLAAPF